MNNPLIWTDESVDTFAERALYPVDRGTVEVRGHARVHLGSIDLSSSVPRGGGLGFSVPELEFKVRISNNGSQRVEPLKIPSTLKKLPMYAERAGINISDARIEFLTFLPEHRGLGSTTQYIVAILQGCRSVLGLPLLCLDELANIGLGAYSSLGIRLAFDGRPLLDLGGQPDSTSDVPFMRRKPRRQAFRLRFPAAWRALVAWPHEVQGLDADADAEFWDHVLPVPESRTFSAMSAILTEMLPGIFDQSFNTFIRGLWRFNHSSSKPEEWSIQPHFIRSQAKLLADLGYTPLLSSVGPAVVVFGESRKALAKAEAVFRRDAAVWQHVTTRFLGRE